MFTSTNFNPKKESDCLSDCPFDHGLAKTLQAEHSGPWGGWGQGIIELKGLKPAWTILFQ